MIKVSKMFGGTHGSRAVACAIASGLALASSNTLAAGVGGREGGLGSAAGPPPNDLCADAIGIVEGDLPVNFSTINATTDGPDDCAVDGGPTSNDIWFRYEALSDREVTVSLCGSGYDTHLSVYDGVTCDPFPTLLNCNNDSPGCVPPTGSQLVFQSVAGRDYLIRVGGFSMDSGTGTVTVTDVALNDDCSNAIEIVEGGLPVDFNTINATTDGPDDCGVDGGPTSNDIWFRYQALNVRQVTVSLCGGDYDTHLAVYDGGTCDPFPTLLDCNNDTIACPAFRNSQVTFLSVAGREYLIRVGGFSLDSGTGTMTVTARVTPGIADNCSNAVVIVEGDPAVNFSTIDATTDGPFDCLDDNGPTFEDIWFRYQALSVKQVTVSLCDSDYDTHLSAYDGGTCPPAVLLDCNDDSPACVPPTSSQVVFLSVPGAEYLFRVGGFFGETGTGIMTVFATDTPGINDECPFALQVFDGPKPFATTVDTSDSVPPLPVACAKENGTLNFGADIWFTYVATCNGMLTIDQCDINYDGRMALYRGFNCPPDDADLVGCNDDACGESTGAIIGTALLPVMVACGDLLTLRVGGWGGAFGMGTFVMTCEGGSCCPWDCQEFPSGIIDVPDLLALLAAWGGPPGEGTTCDLDGSGVIAVPDLLKLLANWGPCPE